MATKLTALFGSGSTAAIGAGATAAVVVAAAVGVTMLRGGDRDDAPAEPPAIASAVTEPAVGDETSSTPAATDSVAPAPDVASHAAEPAMPAQDGVPAVGEPFDPAQIALDPPRFDVVRVDGRGAALIAGRAMAAADVTLRLDGRTIDVTGADATGNFVSLITIAPADEPRILSLVAELADGTVLPGEDSVIIAPFEISEDAPLVVVDAPSEDTGPVTAPGVLLANAEGVRVLQPGSAAPEAQTGLQLDAITYDLTGDVSLAGRAPADTDVRVTLNDTPVLTGVAGPSGDWRIDLPDVDPGTYTLRVEQVAADGSVTDEVVTPFLREDPTRLSDNPMLAEPGAEVITVQPSFTLWGIAQANFGDGVLYVQIFEENRDTIIDPDRIFPGQVFRLPELPRNDG